MTTILIAGISGAIGHALADYFLARDESVRIVGLCRDPASLAFDASVKPRITLISWDAVNTGPEALASDLDAHLGADITLDGVIYAAGFLHGQGMEPEKRLEDLAPGALAHAYAVNATGFAIVVRAVAPRLRHRGFKSLVAISAKVGSITDNGFGGWYAYRSSKAALNMLVKNFAIELPRKCKPIACVAIHPGTTLSPLSEPFSRSLAQLKVHSPAETAENIARVMANLTAEDNGGFLSWDGSSLPW